MIKVYLRNDKENSKLLKKAIKKFNLEKEDIDLVSTDSFLFWNVFIMAISKKKLYLLSADSKKVEIFEGREIRNLKIEKKTDLNLILENNRTINLTSVVSVTKGASSKIKKLSEGFKIYLN